MKNMSKFIPFLSILVLWACNSTQTTTTETGKDNYRPIYHYTPPKNWVNDPNGMVYLDGEYHLFYQYNPFGDKWGHMSWGHAVSKDLKTWETLPLALPEFTNADGDTTMIFSGCAIVDSSNTSGFFEKGFKKGLVAIFTSHIEKKAQHQSLAYSSDKGRTWKYYDKNPVLDIGLKDFRDPNVFWYAPKNKWIMSVVKALEYTIQFYESANLKDWKLLSEFGKTGDVTKIWECPSMLKVPVEGSNESKWVVMVSSGHRQKNYLAMQYFVGDFDGTKFTSQKQESILYVDEGKDFYAAIPFYNLPDSHKKPVIMGWLNDWEYAREIPSTGYRGGFSVPRELSLYLENGTYKLKQSPILSDDIPTETIELKVDDAINSKLATSSNNSYRLQLTINLLGSKGFDLNILKNEGEKSILSYDTATETLSFDRTQSGTVDFHKRFSSIESMTVKPENNQLKLDILVDKSVVEIYANNGKKVLTDLVFPTKENGQIEIVWK
jgi:fructan beta-fructosidase